MNERIGWNFPPHQGQVIGLTSTKMDNKQSRVHTFTKEICQNSSDAVKQKPVIIEFDRFVLPMIDFPDLEGFRKTIGLCQKTAEGSYEEDFSTKEKLEEIQSILSKDSIHVLRISDFNTTGLLGSRHNKISSPWRSLTVSKGISDKNGTSGGSFGRGKDSYYESSKLRTVFFSTLDIDGFEAGIGCSNLMTFEDENGGLRGHFGFLSHNDTGTPLNHQIILESSGFKRTEPGTDIYLTGYVDDSDDWKLPIVHAILKDFFVSIIKGDMIVKVGDIEINNATIDNILENMHERPGNIPSGSISDLKEIFECMRKPPILYPENNPRYELYIKRSDKCNRVVSVRSGMTIHDAFYQSRRNYFVGAIIIISEEVSRTLVKCENVSHNSWNINDLHGEEYTKGKEYINEMKSFIRKESDKLLDFRIGEKLDAAGLGRFLFFDDQTKDDVNMAERDSHFSPVSNVKILQNKPAKTPFTEDFSDKETSPATTDLTPEKEETGPVNPTDNGHSASNKGPKVVEDPDWESGYSRRFNKKKPPIITNIRTLCIDVNSKIYRIWFNSNQDTEASFKIRILEEGDNPVDSAKIVGAWYESDSDINFDDNVIGPISLTKGKRNQIKVALDYPYVCSIKPEVIENGL